jgi:hypothetical protein
MATDERWHLPDDTKDLDRVFAAAKKSSPQVVTDQDGVFTVSFTSSKQRESVQDFLTNGGPDDE